MNSSIRAIISQHYHVNGQERIESFTESEKLNLAIAILEDIHECEGAEALIYDLEEGKNIAYFLRKYQNKQLAPEGFIKKIVELVIDKHRPLIEIEFNDLVYQSKVNSIGVEYEDDCF